MRSVHRERIRNGEQIEVVVPAFARDDDPVWV